MADSLRAQVVRLAASLPEGSLRQALTTVTAGYIQGDVEGNNITGSNVRVTVGDGRYEMVIRLQELPSKPLKRKLRRMEYNGYQYMEGRNWIPEFRGEGGGYHRRTSTSWLFGAENIAQMAGFSASMSFDQAENALRTALSKAVGMIQQDYKAAFAKGAYKIANPGTAQSKVVPATDADLQQALKWAEDNAKWAIAEDTVYFLDVLPHDYKPIEFKGKDFSGTAEWSKFRFYPDNDPSANPSEGMRTFYKEKSAGGARKLFTMLKGDPDIVRNMTQRQFETMLTQAKIAFDYVPTVWR